MENKPDGPEGLWPRSVTRQLGNLSWARSAILVEGPSDQAAMSTLAARLGRDLAREGAAVVAMGGATNIGFYLEGLGPRGRKLALSGLCDAAELGHFLRAADRAGLGRASTPADLEKLGFFVCEPDLEAEMIRSLGVEAVEAIIAAQGELGAFRIFQHQPAQRHRPPEAQLRRFLGTRATRKIRYGALLAQRLDLHRIPSPLLGVLRASDAGSRSLKQRGRVRNEWW